MNNSGFTGKEFDEETRLHYNYFRDYHPSIGRYVAPDLVGLKGGVNKVRPSYQWGKTQKKVNPWLCWEGDLKKREVRMPARKEYWSVLKKWVDTRKNSYEIRK